jgi:hypothetical protein
MARLNVTRSLVLAMIAATAAGCSVNMLGEGLAGAEGSDAGADDVAVDSDASPRPDGAADLSVDSPPAPKDASPDKPTDAALDVARDNDAAPDAGSDADAPHDTGLEVEADGADAPVDAPSDQPADTAVDSPLLVADSGPQDAKPADGPGKDALLLDALPIDSGPAVCTESQSLVFQSHCYFVITTGGGYRWDDAKAACEAKVPAAHLVSLTSKQEADEVGKLAGELWIGLTENSGWKWVTGEAITYDHWAHQNGEPSGDGPCGRRTADLWWRDAPCSMKFNAICEREP